MDRTVIFRIPGLILIFVLCLGGCAPSPSKEEVSPVILHYGAAPDQFIAEAEKGDLGKMMELATMYAGGKINYRRDYTKAVYWYEKAAATGHVPAMYELGVIYEYGAGDVAADRGKAAHWYRMAGERGDAYSQYRLGRVLSKDPSADPVDAEKWFLLAEKSATGCRDNVKCRIILDDKFNYKWELEKRLGEKQKKQARERAREWRADTGAR